MPDNIVDVIHRLQYEVDTKTVDELLSKFTTQLQTITNLQNQIKSYGSQLKVASDPTVVAKLTSEVDRLKDEVGKLTTELGKQVAQNKTLQASIQAQIEKVKTLTVTQKQSSQQQQQDTQTQIGLIQKLEAEERQLLEARDRTNDTDEIQRYNQQLFITRSRLQEMRSTTASAAAGVSRLQFAGAQLLREAPSFAFSLQTGILALSNNIPILLDEIKAAQSAGKSATSIFKELGSAIFGIMGIITIVVAALTIFGDDIAEFFTGAITATERFNEAYAETSKKTADQIANLNNLISVLRSEKSSREDVVEALKDIQDEFPEYLAQLSEENKLTSETNYLITRQIDLLKQRAIQQAYTEAYKKSVEELAEAEAKVFRVAQGDTTFWEDIQDFFGSNILNDARGNVAKALNEATKAAEFAADPQKALTKVLEEQIVALEEQRKKYEQGFTVRGKLSKQYDDEILQVNQQITAYRALLAQLNAVFSAKEQLAKLKPEERSAIQADVRALQAKDDTPEEKSLKAAQIRADLEEDIATFRAASKDKGIEQLTDDDIERLKKKKTFTDADLRGSDAQLKVIQKIAEANQKIEDIYDKKGGRRDRFNSLPYQLAKEIEELMRKGEELRLKGFVTTDAIIIKRLQAERKAAIAEVDIREKQAIAEGKQTTQTREQFAEVRRLIEYNSEQQLQNQTEEFHRKRMREEADFNIKMQGLYLKGMEDKMSLQEEQGEADLWLRKRIAAQQVKLEQAQSDESFRREIEDETRKLKALQETYNLKLDLTVEQEAELQEKIRKSEENLTNLQFTWGEKRVQQSKEAMQKTVEATIRHYEQLKEIQDVYTDAEFAISNEGFADRLEVLIDGYSSREISLGRFRRREIELEYDHETERLRIQKEADEAAYKLAQDNLTRLRNLREKDANSVTEFELTQASAQVSKAKSALTGSRRAVALRGKQPNNFEKFMLGADAFKFETAEERRQAAIERSIELYQELTSTALDSINLIYQAQIQALDREIAYRQSKMDYAVELSRRGNVELLNQERDRLDALQKKREEIANRQLFLDSLMRASAAALTLAQSLQTVANAGATGDPYSTAARIAAAVAALAAGFAAVMGMKQSFETGFSEGGYTGDGGKNEKAGFVHKGEVVFSQADIARHGGVEAVEALRKGSVPVMMARPTSEIRLDGLEEKMDTLIEVMSEEHTTVHNKMDERGWLSMTERAKRKDRNRFKGR